MGRRVKRCLDPVRLRSKGYAGALLVTSAMALATACTADGIAPPATPTAAPAGPSAAAAAPLEFQAREIERKTVPPLPGSVNVTTLGSPGDAFVEACLQAISATIDFFASEYAVDLSAIEVTIGGDLDTFVEAIASARELDGEMADRSALREELRDVGGTVFNDAIFVYHPRSRDDELDAIRWVWEAIPHEATHIMQKRLSGKSAERDWARFLLFIPRWYTEGHADFVGAVVSSRYAPPVFGVGLEVARFRAQLVSDAGSKTLVDVDKDDLGARRVSADDYALGFLAVDLLAGEDVTGHRLLSVWEAFNDHEAYWARAFETSFAMTVEDFYESFERARSTLER